LDNTLPPGDFQYPDSSPSSLSSMSTDIKYDEYIKDLETIIKTLLPVYHDYADIFSPIKIRGPAPVPGPVYSLSKQESSELQDYIAENVAKGFLQPSKSNTGSPVLFVPKKDECFTFSSYVTFINALSWSNFFFEAQSPRRLQLDSNCQRPGMADFNENPVWKFILWHILMISSSIQKTSTIILYAKLSKCKFHNSALQFLRVIVASNSISMHPAKFHKVLDWPKPTSVKTLQGFLGFANFYQKVIKNYSKTIFNLTSLLQKDTPFLFTEKALKEFDALKKAFTTAPILAHFSQLARTLIKTDTSDYAFAGVISQYSSSNLLHPVAFESQKLHNSELNYKIHDKELLAIVFCLQKWCSYLISLSEPFKVLTDHNALKYFMSSEVLTRQKA
ncbi:uncharacterized protein VP01_1305g1, partial [Puccinia sorghi]